MFPAQNPTSRSGAERGHSGGRKRNKYTFPNNCHGFQKGSAGAGEVCAQGGRGGGARQAARNAQELWDGRDERVPIKASGKVNQVAQQESLRGLPSENRGMVGVGRTFKDHSVPSRPVPSCPIPSRPHLPALVPEELAGVFDDLLVGHLGVGLLPAEREGLPQRHTECPHITGCCELALARGSRAGQASEVVGAQGPKPHSGCFSIQIWAQRGAWPHRPAFCLGPEPGELQVWLAVTAPGAGACQGPSSLQR